MGFDLYKAFAADSTKETNGVEVAIGPDAFILVARSNNKSYAKMLTGLFDSNKFAIDRKDAAADALAEKLIIQSMARHVLIGWRGIEEGGVELPYSIAAAEKMLAIKDFRILVSKYADDFQKYKMFNDEEDTKNS